MKTKLSETQILEKIDQAQFDFQDSDENNLLHLLLMFEEQKCVSLDVVKNVLKKAPYLANKPNKKGLLPIQMMDIAQSESERISNRPVRRMLLQCMNAGAVKDQQTRNVSLSFWEQYACDKGKLTDNSRLLPVHAQLFQKPTLLFFSGWRTDNPRFLLGVARSFRKSLKLWRTPTPEIQMLFTQYPGNEKDLSNDCTQIQKPKAQLLADHPIHYVRSFVSEYLRPLYTDKGKRLPLSQAMKNIRVLNFVGYSYGAAVIQMISDAMKLDMKKYHFSEKEIQQIQRQIPAFLIAPYLNPKHSTNDFQSYYLVNTQDKFIYNLIQPALKEKIPEAKATLFTTLNGNKQQKVILLNDPCLSLIKKLKKQFSSKNSEEDPEAINQHDIRCYLQSENLWFRKANAWKTKFLFNMLRNTKKNMASDKLIPLGNLEQHSLSINAQNSR